MSGSRSKSRRRRTGSTSRRYKQSDLTPIRNRRRGAIDTTEIAAAIGISLVGIALIALVWITTMRNINDQAAGVRERTERMVTAQAQTLAEEVRHELLVADQSLAILQAAWAQDPEGFDLIEWSKRMPVLTKVANDLFIADEKQIVRQDILPQAVGQGIGGAYLNFPRGTLELVARDGQQAVGRVIIADTGQAIETRRYLMYVVRPLVKPANWLIGASYRSEELLKLYDKVAIGINGVVALLDSQRGTLQAIAGPASRRPQVDLMKSEMLAAFKAKPYGTWTGPTAMDKAQRIHGFAKVEGREMYVLVGINQIEAMAAAEVLASGAWGIGFAASILVIITCGLLIWVIFHFRATHRRERNQARVEADLEATQIELRLVRNRADTTAGQVAVLLRLSGSGVALVDPELRLTTWNQRFAADCGLETEILSEGLPMDQFIREQANSGLFETVDPDDQDAVETEVARRITILQTEPAGAVLPQFGTDDDELALYVDNIPESGGLVLVLGPATANL